MINTVGIFFYGKDDVEILHIYAPCMPYKVGDQIELKIDNNDRKQWDIKSFHAAVTILKIESRISLAYGKNGIIEHLDFFLSVGVV